MLGIQSSIFTPSIIMTNAGFGWKYLCHDHYVALYIVSIPILYLHVSLCYAGFRLKFKQELLSKNASTDLQYLTVATREQSWIIAITC